MSVVERLLRNDPERRGIDIDLVFEDSDADLASALEQNPFISFIDLCLENVQTTNWGNLLRVIATRANLKNMMLHDADDPEDRNAPPALVSAILRAIQQNSAIQACFLSDLCLPADIFTFVDMASSITDFALCSCDMGPVQRVQGARDLAVALQRNTNIEELELGDMDEVYMSSILPGLRSNLSLKTLQVGGRRFSDVTSRAIQQLLESTTSIQTFELGGMSFENNGDTLRTIVQSLIQSQIVSVLAFKDCEFRDEESVAQFQSILRNKQDLTGLCLEDCDFSGGQAHADIIAALLRPNSPLRSFELKERSIDRALPNDQFRNLLRAIEKSKLEHFDIGSIQSLQQLRALAGSIPLMRIKNLHIVFARNFDGGDPKPLLFQAIKNNFRLRCVQGNRDDGGSIFDANDKTRLVFYANRNQHLARWVDNPEKVAAQKVWPEALKLAEKAGPNLLFCGLRSVLESDYVSLPAGRKRKRPQFYVPS